MGYGVIEQEILSGSIPPPHPLRRSVGLLMEDPHMGFIKILIWGVVVLVALDVFQDGSDLHLLESSHNSMCHVPVHLECKVREQVEVWKAVF
jgi:hypothetical protein